MTTMVVGLVNCKVTKVNGLGDPGGFRTSLVWFVSMFWVLAHNLNHKQVI